MTRHRRLDLTTVPCDKTTARKVMMAAYRAGDEEDVAVRMAEVVRLAVEAWVNATAPDIRRLRGRIGWRHPLDPPTAAPIVGWCRADDAHGEWYLLWTSDAVGGLGGMSWTQATEEFTALDDNARALIAHVAAQRRAPLADGTAPGTQAVGPDGEAWEWRDRGGGTR